MTTTAPRWASRGPWTPGPQKEASDEVHRSGLAILSGPWRFPQDGEWYRCVILEAGAEEVRMRPTGHR